MIKLLNSYSGKYLLMLDLKEPPGLLLHGRHKPYWKTDNNEMKIFFSIIALYI